MSLSAGFVRSWERLFDAQRLDVEESGKVKLEAHLDGSTFVATPLLPLLILSAFLSACDVTTEDRWREEVNLSDGRLITVERTIKWKESQPWGQSKQYIVQQTAVRITASPGQENPAWRSTDEHLIVLDYDVSRREYVLVTRPGTCSRYIETGRPQPPYLEYRLRKGAWTRVAFNDELVGKEANMLVYPQVSLERDLVTVMEKTQRQTGLPSQVGELVATGGLSNC